MAANTTCRAAKVTFVATRSVGVGPGVKMDSQRFWKNEAMIMGSDLSTGVGKV